MSRIGALFLLISAVTLSSFPASALVIAGDLPLYDVSDPRTYQLGDIEIVDGLAYVVTRIPYGDAPSLRILDLSDPTSPVEIGSFRASDAPLGANDVEVVGGLAYITDFGRGGSLRIIDVSDPTAPVEIGAFQAEFDPIDVEVVGNFAYVLDYLLDEFAPNWLVFRVIDVSNPAAPIQVSELRKNVSRHWRPTDFEVVDGFAYVMGSIDSEVIDVSNPAAPVVVASLPDTYLSLSIEVVDGYLYAAGFIWDPETGVQYGLGVINVMDPANPFMVGRSSEDVPHSSIAVVGGLAYVGGNGLTVYDVSDPAAPRQRGSVYSEPLRGLAVYGGYAYLLTDQGLSVVDPSVLDTPIEVGQAEVEGPDGDMGVVNDVEVSDGVAYLAVGDYRLLPPHGLRTFDVSDPTAPTALGGIDTADAALDVEFENGHAYVAVGLDGLRIFDVTTPSAPLVAGGLALPGSTAKLEVIGTTAYVVDQGITHEVPAKLRVIDVSQPASPVELGAVEFPYSRYPRECHDSDIAVVGKLAYVVCDIRLYVVGVSDPAQPTLISSSRLPAPGSSIRVAGDLAYIGDTEGSLSVFDVSDPALPVDVDSVAGGGRALRVEDGLAYSAGEYGLAVHDLTDPRRPVLIGGYPADRGAWRGVAIADGWIFGAVGSGGLQIVDLGPEYLPPQPVEVSIRTDAGTAAINLASRGLIPVTLLGAADFDVTQVNRSSLRFGPGSAQPAHKAGGHLADVNGDGYADLVSHYWVADSGLTETSEQACVTGRTSTGAPFKGCGTLAAILPRGRAGASALAN
jgi:hypothetical protein